MRKKIIENYLLDIFFPIHCLHCGKGNEWLCEICYQKIHLRSEQVCPYCEKNTTPQGKICQSCLARFQKNNKVNPLDGLLVASRYRNNILANLVHYYKYNFIQELSSVLGKILVKSFLKNDLVLPDIIIPVPLHSRRLRWRGFNQSKLLADYISQNISPGFLIPVLENIIARPRHTKPQMKIKKYQERQKNLANVFRIDEKSAEWRSLENKKILLVDDIATTGSTLFECAKVL
ncbi:MAG TPA: double zinc ribbon domain-containing protein, partial [Patescibacteria group bacterium]|nr:double zinc ribbon domain-containing protein [Patescibacteria group bacterium]